MWLGNNIFLLSAFGKIPEFNLWKLSRLLGVFPRLSATFLSGAGTWSKITSPCLRSLIGQLSLLLVPNMVLSKMNNHEHRTKQTYESYMFFNPLWVSDKSYCYTEWQQIDKCAIPPVMISFLSTHVWYHFWPISSQYFRTLSKPHLCFSVVCMVFLKFLRWSFRKSKLEPSRFDHRWGTKFVEEQENPITKRKTACDFELFKNFIQTSNPSLLGSTSLLELSLQVLSKHYSN